MLTKPWTCTCCGLLNSASSHKCQACCAHCAVTESAFVCIKCKMVYSDQICRWSKCNHTYCIKCTSNLINQSLSFHNEMPRCIYSKCNQLLNIENGDLFKDLLLKKYQITQRIKQVYDDDFLVCGYIKRIVPNSHVPKELILVIYDYYKLIYFTKINCYQCKKLGYQVFNCKQCYGKGYTEDCKQCDKSGIYKYDIECDKCDGSGDYIFRATCNKCDGSGIYQVGQCRRCSGTGKWRQHLACRNCNGTGIYSGNCNKCNASGIFTKRHDCRKCSGNGSFPRQRICFVCKGSGKFKIDCENCNASGKVRWDCYKCGGNKILLVLDFNKLCNKQIKCKICNEYYPKNMMMYWSTCYDSFCYKCTASYIYNEINNNRIPICLLLNCNKELTLNSYTNNNYSKHGRYYAKLAGLIYKKDKFCCTICSEWHQNKHLFLWTKCGHQYGRKCAKSYVSTQLIPNDSIFNLLADQFIPKCRNVQCIKLLKTNDAIKLGINDYQHETLKTLWDKKLKAKNVCLMM